MPAPTYQGVSASKTFTVAPGETPTTETFSFTNSDVPAGSSLVFMVLGVLNHYRNSSGAPSIPTPPPGWTLLGSGQSSGVGGATFTLKTFYWVYYQHLNGSLASVDVDVDIPSGSSSGSTSYGRGVLVGYSNGWVSSVSGGSSGGEDEQVVGSGTLTVSYNPSTILSLFIGSNNVTVTGDPTVNTANGFTSQLLDLDNNVSIAVLDKAGVTSTSSQPVIDWGQDLRWGYLDAGLVTDSGAFPQVIFM